MIPKPVTMRAAKNPWHRVSYRDGMVWDRKKDEVIGFITVNDQDETFEVLDMNSDVLISSGFSPYVNWTHVCQVAFNKLTKRQTWLPFEDEDNE